MCKQISLSSSIALFLTRKYTHTLFAPYGISIATPTQLTFYLLKTLLIPNSLLRRWVRTAGCQNHALDIPSPQLTLDKTPSSSQLWCICATPRLLIDIAMRHRTVFRSRCPSRRANGWLSQPLSEEDGVRCRCVVSWRGVLVPYCLQLGCCWDGLEGERHCGIERRV